SHIRVGSRVPAFLTAPGRVMLAQLGAAEFQRLWAAWRDDAADPVGKTSGIDPAELARQLEEDGRKGHAWSFSGYEAGINACAAVVKGSGGRPVAALSVVVPQQLFDADPGLKERMQSEVVQAARDLSRVAGG